MAPVPDPLAEFTVITGLAAYPDLLANFNAGLRTEAQLAGILRELQKLTGTKLPTPATAVAAPVAPTIAGT